MAATPDDARFSDRDQAQTASRTPASLAVQDRERQVFTGHLHFRRNGGPMTQTTFCLEICGDHVTLTYGDGVVHLSDDPATVAYFSAGLVPSLQAVDR